MQMRADPQVDFPDSASSGSRTGPDEWPFKSLLSAQEARRVTLLHGTRVDDSILTTSVFLILSGCIRCVMRPDDEHENIIALMRPGNVVGFLAAIDGLPPIHEYYSEGRCELLTIPRATVKRLFAEDKDFALHVAHVLCDRVRQSYSFVEQYAVNPRRRLARKLLMVMTSFGRHANGRYVLDLRLSQDNWAAMAGLTRQTVNKELGRLKSDGLIALENGKLVILNREAIKQIAYY